MILCYAFMPCAVYYSTRCCLPSPKRSLRLSLIHGSVSGGHTNGSAHNPSCHTPLAASRARPLHRRSLGLGPKAVAGQRGRPHSARRRGVAASRASRKKGQNYHFFLTHSNGNRRPVAGVGGTKIFSKIFWGRGEKKDKTLPPLTPSPTYVLVRVCLRVRCLSVCSRKVRELRRYRGEHWLRWWQKSCTVEVSPRSTCWWASA